MMPMAPEYWEKTGPERLNISSLHDAPNIYQTETMSKALGVYGGFVSAGREIINRIRKNSPAYMASTSLPPPIVSAAIASIKIVRQQSGTQGLAVEKCPEMREGVIRLGFNSSNGRAPSFPFF